MSLSRKNFLSWAILGLWLPAVSFYMWHSFLADKDDYSEVLAEFDIPSDISIAPSGKITMVHYTDQACACSRFAEPHVKDLQSQYSDLNHFVYSPSGERGLSHPLSLRQANNREHNVELPEPPFSPATAIFDWEGQLVYIGPYSAGAICGQGNDLISPIIEQLESGSTTLNSNHISVFGCYCSWHQTIPSRGHQYVSSDHVRKGSS